MRGAEEDAPAGGIAVATVAITEAEATDTMEDTGTTEAGMAQGYLWAYIPPPGIMRRLSLPLFMSSLRLFMLPLPLPPRTPILIRHIRSNTTNLKPTVQQDNGSRCRDNGLTASG